MTLLGEADTVLCNDKHSVRTVVLVASYLNHSALIGWQDLQKLRVIPASFPAVAAVARCYSKLKTKTLSAFPDVFFDTLDSRPMCAQKMKIYLKDNCVPYRVSAYTSQVSRTRQRRNIKNTLPLVSSHLVIRPLNGAHQLFSSQRGTANVFGW